ncbi:MAG: hypothetical protein ABI927_08615 [Gaiellaceae bacterium]
MRMIGILAAALAIGVAGIGDAAGSAAKANLRLTDRQPLSVQGRYFLSGERVRLRVSGEVSASRIVRANAAGSFTVRFGDITVDRCNVIRVVAVGGRGSQATLKMLPAPACNPA